MTTTAASIFTPPRSCSTTWAGTGYVQLGVRCLSGTLTGDPDCVPPATETITACPFNWQPLNTVLSTTTCCPGEFSIPQSFSGLCYSSAGGEVLEGVTCAPGSAAIPVTVTYTFTPGVWAEAVTYVGVTTPTSITPTASSDATPSVTPSRSSATAPPTSSPTNLSPKPALSAGAIAGIAIGAIAVVALVLTTIILLRKRHRESQATSGHQATSHTLDEYRGTRVEMDAATADRNGKFGTPMSTQSYSAPFGAAPMELEGSNANSYANYR